MSSFMLVPVSCFYCRRPEQARFQTRSHSGRSTGRKPQGAQRPVSPWGMQGFAAGRHPHPSPAQREAPAVPARTPSPLLAEAAAGVWHLRHPPGECVGRPGLCPPHPPLWGASSVLGKRASNCHQRWGLLSHLSLKVVKALLVPDCGIMG